jgi:hypothetical protein
MGSYDTNNNNHTSYEDAPYWMNAKTAGKDFNGVSYSVGTPIFYNPVTKRILSGEAARIVSEQFDQSKRYTES